MLLSFVQFQVKLSNFDGMSKNSAVIVDFYPRDAVLTRYLLSSRVCLSVHPSVCLSVCLSQAGTVPKNGET